MNRHKNGAPLVNSLVMSPLRNQRAAAHYIASEARTAERRGRPGGTSSGRRSERTETARVGRGGGASENDAPDENAATGAPPSVVAFARTYVDIIQIILSRAVAAALRR